MSAAGPGSGWVGSEGEDETEQDAQNFDEGHGVSRRGGGHRVPGGAVLAAGGINQVSRMVSRLGGFVPTAPATWLPCAGLGRLGQGRVVACGVIAVGHCATAGGSWGGCLWGGCWWAPVK